jgi:CcmD family protein
MLRRIVMCEAAGRILRGALIGVLVAMVFGAEADLLAAQPPTTAAQEGFVPVDQLPPDEQLPAAPLLVAAYAVAWLAVFGYLWSIWQRLSRVERDIAEVSRRIEAGARR